MGHNHYGVTPASRGSPDLKLRALDTGGFYLVPAQATATTTTCAKGESGVSGPGARGIS